ncbi:DUF4007 family protein [Orenia marismortui]|uniref:Uncharacterized protein DUF4007 n=1 Tax=Orenia marismortui TaxID=46469 RepID=A0A4R8H130_9FIRM|nr:DUF4007 family protein [Orenia marismortui]TDX53238.1 uncharacterized protein DUF4007 [Orenia marismortui]
MSGIEELNSGQRFKFEVDYIISLLKLINGGNKTKDDLQNEKGLGKNKIDAFSEWLRISEVVTYSNQEFELTKFGKTIINLKYNYDYFASLLLYKLSRGKENGGHFYFSKLINNIFYNYAFSLNNKVSLSNIESEILNYKDEIGVDENSIIKLANQNLSTIVDPDTGFGKLGMIKKLDDDEYEVYSYWAEPLVCAYIIYDQWEEGSVAMKIDEIVSAHYNIGRIFFMDRDTVMGVLEDLEYMDYLSIETTGGLDQIRINPKINKEDILEAIIDEV